MQVGLVKNTQPFFGKTSETDLGSEYEKSNTGKLMVPLIAAGVNSIEYFAVEAKNSGFKASRLAAKVGVSAVVALIVGAITDALVNSKRRKDADKLSVTEKVEGNTHKGKIITGCIGLALGSLSFVGLNKMKVSNALKYSVIPMSLLTWLTPGVIYDNGVNKFRGQLKNQESKKSQEKPKKQEQPKLDKKV